MPALSGIQTRIRLAPSGEPTAATSRPVDGVSPLEPQPLTAPTNVSTATARRNCSVIYHSHHNDAYVLKSLAMWRRPIVSQRPLPSPPPPPASRIASHVGAAAPCIRAHAPPALRSTRISRLRHRAV